MRSRRSIRAGRAPATPSPEAAASVAATIPPVSAAAIRRQTTRPDRRHRNRGNRAGRNRFGAHVEQAQSGRRRDGHRRPNEPGAKARPTQMSKAANMRSRPKSGSGIIMVVPQSATCSWLAARSGARSSTRAARLRLQGFPGWLAQRFKFTKSKSSAKKPKAVKTVDTSDAGTPTMRRDCPAWKRQRSSRLRPGCNNQHVADGDQRQACDRVRRPRVAFERR